MNNPLKKLKYLYHYCKLRSEGFYKYDAKVLAQNISGYKPSETDRA